MIRVSASVPIWMEWKFSWPQEAIDIQDGLHSDIAMCLDECPSAEATRDEVQVATDRTYPLGRTLPSALAKSKM